jgi:hypothetical protein
LNFLGAVSVLGIGFSYTGKEEQLAVGKQQLAQLKLRRAPSFLALHLATSAKAKGNVVAKRSYG